MKKTGYPEINLNVVVVSREKFQRKKQKTSEKKTFIFSSEPQQRWFRFIFTQKKTWKNQQNSWQQC